MTLAFVSAHPAPYRDPFLRRLSGLESDAFQLKIYTLYSSDNAHSFWNLGDHGYDSEIVGIRGTHWFIMFWRLFRKVICGSYDVICWPGFHRPCTKWAMVLCALIGRRYGFCADSIEQPQRGGLMMAVKRFVIRRSSFIFVPGHASKDFFVREFNYPPERICLGQYALEGVTIEGNILKLRKENRNELRQKYGLEVDDIVFVMVANMLPFRHYPITTAAFVRFAARHPKVKFVMVGKGDDLALIQERAKTHPELVIVPGVSFAEMQELYALADVYVHGGKEPASSALVIGAIAHLPVMSSPAVGCTADVVRDEKVEESTGVMISDYLSENEWEDGFERMWARRARWSAYGERARELSRKLDCENAVRKFCELVIIPLV